MKTAPSAARPKGPDELGWWSWILPCAALAAVWLPIVLRLGRVWSVVPGQTYGWAVPLLALALARERWRTRPDESSTDASRGLAVFVTAGGLGLLALTSPVLEANAAWPTVQWLAVLAAMLVTLGGVAYGYGWVIARHLLFPVAFMATALSWPTAVNTRLVAGLVGMNATLAAEVVSALGRPAVVSGNVIAVSGGWVGIDEACSGLRSLQATWMLAWFLGEFFGLGWSRRGMLVACSLVLAVLGNLVRTVFLTWQAAAHGLAAGERWHDPAGTIELVGTLAVVVGCALWIARRRRAPSEGENVDDRAVPRGRRSRFGPLGACLLATAVAVEAGTQAWYGWHELKPAAAKVRWELTPPADWTAVPLAAGVAEVLRYDRAQGFTDGRDALVYAVSWTGATTHGENAEWHDPTVCVPAAGAMLEREIGARELLVGGVRVPFAGYRFTAGGQPLQVFFCHWDAEVNSGRAALDVFDVRALRLLRVKEGRRRGQVTHLIFAVRRAEDAAAWQWFERWAPELLAPRPSDDVGVAAQLAAGKHNEGSSAASGGR